MKIGLIIAAAAAVSAAAAYGTHRHWHPLPPKVRKGKRHIVCIGDSITFGAGVVPFQRWRSYPAYLQKLLGKEYQVMNFGLSGRTLLSTGDMPYTKEKHYIKAFQVENAHYLVMLGTNDSKPFNWNENGYREELFALLKQCKAYGTVTVMKPPKAFPSKKTGAVPFDVQDDVLRIIGEIIGETAEKLDIAAIDLYAFTERHMEWFADGIHPNTEGNRHLSEYIYKHL